MYGAEVDMQQHEEMMVLLEEFSFFFVLDDGFRLKGELGSIFFLNYFYWLLFRE